MPVLLCVCVAAVAAPLPTSPKAPWEWTIQERIAVRFDPASMRERAEASDHQQPVQFQSAGQSAITPMPTIGEYISGDRNPELLLPWELFNSLIREAFNVKDDERQYWRRKFTERTKGIALPPDFWARLDFVAQPYIEAEHRFMRELGRKEQSSSAQEQAQRMKDLEALRKTHCPLRARALKDARAEFGSEFFDRFLYTAVAPGLVISSPNPMPAEDELHIEAGCP